MSTTGVLGLEGQAPKLDHGKLGKTWYPVMEFRWLKNKSRVVLQQKWQEFDQEHLPMDGPIEWRDIPIVEDIS